MTDVGYRRLVLELGVGPADPAFIRAAAQFAHGLGLDLHGLFIEDESLLTLAAYPVAREIRLPSRQWAPLDANRIAEDLHLAAESARRQMFQALSTLGLHGGFEVVRGDPHGCVCGMCCDTDIIVVTANHRHHAHPGDSRTLLRRAAAESAASVLVLPDATLPRHGPIVVAAEAPDDPGLLAAARIASADRAPLLVLMPEGSGTMDVATVPLPPDRVQTHAVAGLHPDDLLRALSHVRERLLVVTRRVAGALGSDGAARIATLRRVPVLVL